MADDDVGVMHGAQVGDTVRTPTPAPSWIVVDRSIASIVVAGWPGRLLEVEILEPCSEQAGPRANYTRCLAVRVLAEHPVSSLFGPKGPEVLKVIERARRLDQDDVKLLSEQVDRSLEQVYSDCWNTWLAPLAPDSYHLGNYHPNTLAIFTDHERGKTEVGYSVSPIGAAFLVLSRVVSDRAREVLGDAAFTIDEDGDECLDKAWSMARDAACNAAMAVGAPHLMTDSKATSLKSAWARLSAAFSNEK